MTKNIVKKLRKYYESKKISATNFKCEYRENCENICKKKKKSRFSTAKEAYVGKNYAKGNIPRLLFLSLEPGYSSERPSEKTIQGVTKSDLERVKSRRLDSGWKKNIHWRQTLKFANIVFIKMAKGRSALEFNNKSNRNFNRLFTEKNPVLITVMSYFAHTNSAKCSFCLPGNKKAPEKIFKNCREFILDEIRLLDPDILVTQGKSAFKVISDGEEQTRIRVNPRKHISGENYSLGTTRISKRNPDCAEFVFSERPKKKILWLRFTHPRGEKNNKKIGANLCYDLYANEVVSFLNKNKKKKLSKSDLRDVEKMALAMGCR